MSDTDVVPKQEEVEEDKSLVKLCQKIDLQVGDLLLEIHDGTMLRISEITDEFISIESLYHDEWHSYGRWTHNDIKRRLHEYARVPRGQTLADIEKLTLDTISKPIQLDAEQSPVENETHSLVATNVDLIKSHKKRMEEEQNKFSLMEAVLHRKVNALNRICRDLASQVDKAQRVLWIIELYMGTKEEVIQLQSGSPNDDPICIRQQLLYMDEEVGVNDPMDQGIDFQTIEKFDEWLLKDMHYKILLPESKGVVAIRVRRNDKDYGDDLFTNYICNLQNQNTYLLIRNGENLYRIWSDLNIRGRLFPLRDEILKLQESNDSFYRDEFEKVMEKYKFQMLAIQGIIDRTPIFHPLPHPIILFDQSTWGNELKLIYDDEPQLTDGKLRWRDYMKSINAKVAVGSRIHILKVPTFNPDKYDTLRYSFRPRNAHYPEAGVYNVVKIMEKGNGYNSNCRRVYVSFKLDGERWTGYDYQPYKGSCSFYLYDDEFLNYDDMAWQDIEYYLHSRLDRSDYLKILPTLKHLAKMKKVEEEQDMGFVSTLLTEFGEDKRNLILEGIKWWKFKVISHRELIREDAKALRMIRGYVRRKIKELKKSVNEVPM